MWSMNLLIFVAIVFAYFFIGGGVYALWNFIAKDPWDDGEAVFFILLWPFFAAMGVCFGTLYLVVKLSKKLWIRLITAVLIIFRRNRNE